MTRQLSWAVGKESFPAWGGLWEQGWGRPFSEITGGETKTEKDLGKTD